MSAKAPSSVIKQPYLSHASPGISTFNFFKIYFSLNEQSLHFQGSWTLLVFVPQNRRQDWIHGMEEHGRDFVEPEVKVNEGRNGHMEMLSVEEALCRQGSLPFC